MAKQLRRDSFSDRIYDDLCEDILHWLPIRDKLRLILVSKQFKTCLKTVCLRQKVLRIGNFGDNQRKDCLNLLRGHIENNDKLSRSLAVFPNIRQIIWPKDIALSNSAILFDAIYDNCERLESFEYDFRDIDAEAVINFAQKFGHYMKSLNIRIGNQTNRRSIFNGLQRLLSYCPSLESLKLSGCPNALFQDIGGQELPEVMVNNLKRLTLTVNHLMDFKAIVANNPKLTHLDIELDVKTSLEACCVLKEMSHLEDLKDLRIRYKDHGVYDQRMTFSIDSIAKKCKILKSFHFEVFNRNAFKTQHFAEGLENFSNLKRFKLHSINYDNYSRNQYSLQIDCIRNCKQLTHLTLVSDIIPKNFFADIHSVFPLLKYLNIELEDELTDNELKSMAKLKNLEELTIIRSNYNSIDSITDSGLLYLIGRSDSLQSLTIYSEIQMTESSLNAIVEKADHNHRIYFKYTFQRPNSCDEKFIKKIENKCKQLKNIEITFY